MECGLHILEALEPGIDEAVRRTDELDALDRLEEYAKEVGELFRQVDTNLKQFCFDLREKTRPLKTILDMCRGGEQHA
jgi:chaperonin cofactor prefoldin